MVIIFQKAAIVTLKVFFEDSFYQAPLAFLLLLGLAVSQSFARPFDDTSFDILQSVATLSLLFYVFLGQLLNTTLGIDESPLGFNRALNSLFLTSFICVTGFMLYHLLLDIRNRMRTSELVTFCEDRGLHIIPSNYKLPVLYQWIKSGPTDIELAFFNMATEPILRRIEPLPLHLEVPYRTLSIQCPGIFVWLLEDSNSGVLGSTFTEALRRLLDVHNPPPDDANNDIGNNFQGTSNQRVLEFVGKRLVQVWNDRLKSIEETTQEFNSGVNPVRRLFMVPSRSKALNGLLLSGVEDRQLFARALRMVVQNKRLDPQEETRYRPLIESRQRRHRGQKAALNEADSRLVEARQAALEPDVDPPTGVAVTVTTEDASGGPKTASQNPQMKSGIPPIDLEALIAKLFARYDVDDSGTINTVEELRQLTMNLLYKLGGVEEGKVNGSAKYIWATKAAEIAVKLDDAGELDDNNAWDIRQYTDWFKAEFALEWATHRGLPLS